MTDSITGIRALTLQQPWAWVITDLGKDVENRRWSTEYRGLLAIHAGAKVQAPLVTDMRRQGEQVPTKLATSAIVAITRLTEVHSADSCRGSCSTWAETDKGLYHWVLSGTRSLTPIACKGALRLWIPPAGVVAAIDTQVRHNHKG